MKTISTPGRWPTTWGLDDTVSRHAQRVYAAFKRNGVRKVITVDPHTTNMLRSVYPTMIEGYDMEVASYLEVLAQEDLVVRTPLDGAVAIHDSCIFARSENVLQAATSAVEPNRHHCKGACQCRAPHVVLRRSGRIAVPAQGPGQCRTSRGAAS